MRDISKLLSFYTGLLHWPVVFAEATEKAIELGAKIADEQYGGKDWITMIDPAGHPFCFVIWD